MLSCFLARPKDPAVAESAFRVPVVQVQEHPGVWSRLLPCWPDSFGDQRRVAMNDDLRLPLNQHLVAYDVVSPVLALEPLVSFKFRAGQHHPPLHQALKFLSTRMGMQLRPMTHQERLAKFGSFKYIPTPTQADPEAIRITDGWESANLVTLELPWQGKKVRVHRLAADQIRALWEDWRAAGLLDRILTFDGAWVARYKRGKTGTSDNLSNHSWGSAFDLNATWNRLNYPPAQMGAKGCLLELVPFAEKHGIVWGGNFKSRVDAMHWELGITV